MQISFSQFPQMIKVNCGPNASFKIVFLFCFHAFFVLLLAHHRAGTIFQVHNAFLGGSNFRQESDHNGDSHSKGSETEGTGCGVWLCRRVRLDLQSSSFMVLYVHRNLCAY